MSKLFLKFIYIYFLFSFLFILSSCNTNNNSKNKNFESMITKDMSLINDKIYLDLVNDESLEEKVKLFTNEIKSKININNNLTFSLLDENFITVDVFNKNNHNIKQSKKIKLIIKKYYTLNVDKNIRIVNPQDKYLINSVITIELINPNNLLINKISFNDIDIKDKVNNNFLKVQITKKSNISVEYKNNFNTKINTNTALDLIEKNKDTTDFVILDVRTKEEFKEGHLKNAINLNVMDNNFINKIRDFDRNKTYLIYCRTGNRANLAIQKMEELNFNYLYVLEGGYEKWVDENKPISKINSDDALLLLVKEDIKIIDKDITIKLLNDDSIEDNLKKIFDEIKLRLNPLNFLNFSLNDSNKIIVTIFNKQNAEIKETKIINLIIEKYYTIFVDENIKIIDPQEKYLIGSKVRFKILNPKSLIIEKLIFNDFDIKEKIVDNFFDLEINGKTKLYVQFKYSFSIEVNTDTSLNIINENKNNQNFVLLDVRTEAEFNEGHLENAVNINMFDKNFKDKLQVLDKNKTYLVYCRTENRSRTVIKQMKEMNFNYLYTMIGGYTTWSIEDKPIIKPEYNKILDVEVKTNKTNFKENDIVEVDVSVYNLQKQPIRHANISIKIHDSKNNIVSIILENKKVNDFGNYKKNFEIDNRFIKNKKYIIVVEANHLNYSSSKGIKIFHINSNIEDNKFYDLEKNVQKGIYDHLPINDLNFNFIKNKFKTNLLKYQVIDKNQNKVSLYQTVDLNKKSIIMFVYPGCGPCVGMWESINKYDMHDFNIIPIITSVDLKNPNNSIQETLDILKKSEMENFFETTYYDSIDMIWGSRMEFKTTPKFIFLDEYGYLINAITHVEDFTQFISLFEKTFNLTEKIILKPILEESDQDLNIPNITDENRKYLSFEKRKQENLFLDLYDETVIKSLEKSYGNNIFATKVKGFYENQLAEYIYKKIDDKQKITILALINSDDDNSIDFIKRTFESAKKIKSKVNFFYLDYSNNERMVLRNKVQNFIESDDEINGFFLFSGKEVFLLSEHNSTEPFLIVLDKYGQLIDITSSKILNQINKVITNVGNNVSNFTFNDRSKNGEYQVTDFYAKKKKDIINKSFKYIPILYADGKKDIKIKDLIDNSKYSIIIIGSKKCGACFNLLKKLEKIDPKIYDYVNIYYDLLSVNSQEELISYANSYSLPNIKFIRGSFETVSSIYTKGYPSACLLDKNYRYINNIDTNISLDVIKDIIQKVESNK